MELWWLLVGSGFFHSFQCIYNKYGEDAGHFDNPIAKSIQGGVSK